MMVKVRIIVVDLDSGEEIRRHDDVPWLNNNARDWLIRMGKWAFETNHGIQILNMTAKEPAEKNSQKE